MELWSFVGGRLAGARSERIGGRDGHLEGHREGQRGQAAARQSCSSRVPHHAALMVRSRWLLKERREACRDLGASPETRPQRVHNALPGTQRPQGGRACPTRGPNAARPALAHRNPLVERQSEIRCPLGHGAPRRMRGR